MDNQRCIEILKAVKAFEISKGNLEQLHDLQYTFDRYLQKLLKMGDEVAVHYLVNELYKELLSSKQIEGDRNMSPRDILNNNIIILGKYLTNKKICKIQKIFLDSESNSNKSEIGQYRSIPVFIPTYNDLGYPSVYQAPDPSLVSENMKEFVMFFNRNSDSFIDNDPFIKSALLHALFVSIHPFRDGNGRTARLLHNLKFTSLVNKTYSDEHNNFILNLQLCPLSISDRINQNKTSYYQKLGSIQLGNIKNLNEALNDWLRFLLFMYEEQLYYIEHSKKLEQISEIRLDTLSNQLIAGIFTDEHYGEAISNQEFEIWTIWQNQNSKAIEDIKQIIKKDPVFKKLPFEAKIRYVKVLLDIEESPEKSKELICEPKDKQM